ncbi:MAG: response regulator [Dehalococcoidia bacterium]|nr:MAG: response regulator [Dehalococcoidia bacterium]
MASILVVDDEPVVRALLRAALAPAGSRVVEAVDGSEALEVAWREQPDVVLLDVGLPKLSGLDVCRALKTNPAAPRVLLITGNANLERIDDCGADGVVTKPFHPAELLELVRHHLAEAATAAA